MSRAPSWVSRTVSEVSRTFSDSTRSPLDDDPLALVLRRILFPPVAQALANSTTVLGPAAMQLGISRRRPAPASALNLFPVLLSLQRCARGRLAPAVPSSTGDPSDGSIHLPLDLLRGGRVTRQLRPLAPYVAL